MLRRGGWSLDTSDDDGAAAATHPDVALHARRAASGKRKEKRPAEGPSAELAPGHAHTVWPSGSPWASPATAYVAG